MRGPQKESSLGAIAGHNAPDSSVFQAGSVARTLIPTVFIAAVAIFAVVLIAMLHNRSFGASGDDSVGYILAAENLVGGRVVYKDEIYGTIRRELGTDVAASFLPSHYVPADGNARVVTKYSIGFPALLAAGRALFGPMGYSLVAPILGAIAVAATFLLCMEWFREESWRWPVALVAAGQVFVSPIFFSSSVSQPMSEGAVVAVSVLAFLALSVGMRRRNVWLVGIAGILFGIGFLIRVPAILLILPAFALIAAYMKDSWKSARLARLFSAFVISFLIAASPYFAINAAATGNPLLSFRAGHAASLNPANLLSRAENSRIPGSGGIRQYGRVLESALPLGLVGTLVLAVGVMYRPLLGVTLVLWAVPAVLFYAAWVNPYPRYIQPVLPALAIGASVGLARLLEFVLEPRMRSLAPAVLVMSTVVLVLLLPRIISGPWGVAALAIGSEKQITKWMTQGDTQELDRLGELLGRKRTVILYDGDMQESRGAVEAFSGMRTATTRHYRIEDGTVNQSLDQQLLASAVDALLGDGFEVFLWSTGKIAPRSQWNYLMIAVTSFDLSYEPMVVVHRVTPLP